MAVNLRQTHFRFGIDELAESTHGWYAAEDTNINLRGGVTFLLRFTEQETGGTAAGNTDAQFQYNKNGAGWNNITTSSAVVRAVAAAAFANGANCTKRLSGTGTFESSAAGCTEDGTSGGTTNDIAASGNSETECGLQVVLADVARGDTIQFRFTSPDWTVGYDVTPTLTVLQDVALVADPGSYTLTGVDATLVAGRVLNAEPGAYALTGADATLAHGYALNAEPGAYTLSGLAAGLFAARVLNAEPGAYNITGADAGLLAGRVLSAEAGTYFVTGADASVLAARVLAADPGAYTLTGLSAILVADRVLIANPGSYLLTGAPATLDYTGGLNHYTLNAESGSYTLTGADAGLSYEGQEPPPPSVDSGGFTVRTLAVPIRRLKKKKKQTVVTASGGAAISVPAIHGLGRVINPVTGSGAVAFAAPRLSGRGAIDNSMPEQWRRDDEEILAVIDALERDDELLLV